MNYPVIFAIVFCLATTNHASNDGGCTIDGINWSNNLYTNEPILDTDILKKDFTFTGDLEVNCSPVGNSCRYIAASVEGNTLTFATTQAFIDNFEEETMEVADQVRINVNVIFTCVSGDTSLTFRVDVTGTNNHDPEYLESTYEFLVPMPMLPKIDITTLGPQIIAKDIDFSNTNIVFTIDPADKFLITTQNLGNKQYRAAISVSEATRLSEDTTFQLTATDDGGVPVVSSVTIKIDRDSSLPNVPLFSGPFFNFDYSVVDGNAVLTPSDGDITVITDFPDLTTVTLTGNDLFAADYNKETNVVTINALGVLVDPVEHVIVLTLDAKIDGNSQSGTTAILIHIPDEIMIQVPKFSSPFYAATYSTDSEPHTVTVDGDIFVTDNADNVDVALTGGYATNFKITPTGTDPKTYVIEVTTNLEDSVLKTGTEIILTLEATVPDQADKGYASVVLSLPQIPKISESYYLAVYTVKDPDTDEVTITNGPIAYSSDSLAPVTATLTGDLADEYFTFTDVGDGTCTLQLTKDFDPTILSQGEDVIVTVVTSLPWGSNSIAPVIIKLPTVSTAPEFSSPVYTADYTIVADGSDTVTLSGSSITIVGDDSGAIPVVIADDSPYKENFGITFEAGIWQLSVTSDLSSDVLNENAEIMLILDAGEGAKKGHAPLLVKLPEKTSDIVPEFSALYFTASYLVDESSADTVTINEPITITSDQADLTAVRVTGTYASNFEANFDATSWQLVVTADFEADFITHNPEIYVTLEATLDGAKKPGGATVVMKLPSATLLPAPRFVKAHYTADYQVDGGGAATVVMTSDPIAVVSDNSDSVTLTGTNSANFKLDHADGSWNLGIETPLDAAVVAAGGEIILELQAKLDGAIDDGFATLLIKLPAVVPVAFDQTYYEATYTPNDGTNDDEITSNAITLTESGTVEVTGDYSTNFGVTCDAAYKCLLSVTTDLSDDVLNSQTEVLIALQASKAGDEANKATATVLVNLPRKEEINTPHFSQTVYTVTYARNEGVDVITLDNGPISIPGEDFEKLTVTVTGTHEESFTVTPVDDHWEISLAADLPDDVLNDETLLALELKATLEGSSSPGSAALVVKLPKKQTPTAFYFSAPVYIGEYADETTPEIVMEQEIVIQGDFLDNIDVVLEGEHSEFFTPNYDAAGKVTVAVDELPDEILDNNLIITLDVLASLRGSDSAPVTAGLVVKLAQQSPGSLISFSDVVYEAQYSDDDGPKLDVDGDITIDGPGGLEIDVTVTGEYAKYFTSTYADGKVTLQVSEIPSSVTDEKAVITINLEATVAATTTKTLAGLVVKLPLASGDSSGSDDPDVTAYIVVICLLSVLMVGFILASAYVYYRKRRGRKHADVEEYMNTENKFTRNPKVSEVNKFDHPTRRATGMIRYSISLPDDGSPPDSTTDMEEAPPERRKSVQFDDNVEERPIDSREHDDSDNESSDGSDRGEDSVSNRSDEGSHHEDRTQM